MTMQKLPRFAPGDVVDVKLPGVETGIGDWADWWEQGKVAEVQTPSTGPVYKVVFFSGHLVTIDEAALFKADQ